MVWGSSILYLYLCLYRTRRCGAGLAALRLDHLAILANLARAQGRQADGEAALADRIAAVTTREGGSIYHHSALCAI